MALVSSAGLIPPHLTTQLLRWSLNPLTFHYSKMVQIKLSVAFVLAAAAIAPVVAQPIHEGRGHVGHHGHHGHHHHHHHHAEAPAPQDPSSEWVDENSFNSSSLIKCCIVPSHLAGSTKSSRSALTVMEVTEATEVTTAATTTTTTTMLRFPLLRTHPLSEYT